MLLFLSNFNIDIYEAAIVWFTVILLIFCWQLNGVEKMWMYLQAYVLFLRRSQSDSLSFDVLPSSQSSSYFLLPL